MCAICLHEGCSWHAIYILFSYFMLTSCRNKDYIYIHAQLSVDWAAVGPKNQIRSSFQWSERISEHTHDGLFHVPRIGTILIAVQSIVKYQCSSIWLIDQNIRRSVIYFIRSEVPRIGKVWMNDWTSRGHSIEFRQSDWIQDRSDELIDKLISSRAEQIDRSVNRQCNVPVHTNYIIINSKFGKNNS